MRLDLKRDQLKKILPILRTTLGDAKLMPILEHFLFEVKNNVLTIKATNSISSSVWTFPIQSDLDFSFTLSSSIIVGLINSLTTNDLILEYDPETLNVKLLAGTYEWETVSGEVSDYPRIEIPKDLKEIILPNNFSSLLKNVAFAISDDTKQRDMNSLCLEINKNSFKGLRLIATDRIRLCCASAEITTEESLQFIIPKESVIDLIKLEPYSLLYNEYLNRLYFKLKSINTEETLIFQTILTNAKYPDIYAYLKDSFDNIENITLEKSKLIDSLKRIKLVSDKVKRVGTLDILDNKMILSSLNNLNKCKETILIQSDLRTSFDFNIDFVLDYLNNESDSKINFKIIDKKCVIFDKINYRYVLSIK